MKKMIAVMVLLVSGVSLCFAWNWKTSSSNFENSSANWNNSSSNFKNSPSNWDNSPNNYGSTNGIYSDKGERIGYYVPKENGGSNIYANDGDRIGYTPAREDSDDTMKKYNRYSDIQSQMEGR